jgi:hypothetical protein
VKLSRKRLRFTKHVFSKVNDFQVVMHKQRQLAVSRQVSLHSLATGDAAYVLRSYTLRVYEGWDMHPHSQSFWLGIQPYASCQPLLVRSSFRP